MRSLNNHNPYLSKRFHRILSSDIPGSVQLIHLSEAEGYAGMITRECLYNASPTFLYQKEESCGLTAAAVQQREKEIKLSQIGLIIVAGRQLSSGSSFSHPP